MKRNMLLLAAICSCCNLFAEEVIVKQFRHAGPYEVKKPFLNDSLDVNSKKFTEKELLKTAIPFSNVRQSTQILEANANGEGLLPASSLPYQIGLASFYLNSDRYVKGNLQVKGPETYEVYINNEKQTPADGKIALTLEPHRYEVVIKYLAGKDKAGSLKVTFDTEAEATVTATTDPEKRYTISEVFDGTRFRSVSLSPNGKYLLTSYQTTFPGGETASNQQVTDKASGQVLVESSTNNYSWMPQSNRLYYTRKGLQGKELVSIDPVTKTETILSANLPDGWFVFAPTEDYLIFMVSEEGPKKDKDMEEIIVPDDRQPGWRNRFFLHKYDLATGLFERLTYGHNSTAINDISKDGRYLLFTSRERTLTQRPFSTTTLYRMDLQTMQTEEILKDPFIGSASFSPDGTQLAIEGSGEAFGGIGLNIAPGQTSNTADGQLFIYDLAGKQITPVSKDFDPSIQSVIWNNHDKQIYLQGEDKDCVRLYVLNPSNGKINPVPLKEDILSDFTIATSAPELVYFGESASNSQRLYSVNLKKNTTVCLKDLSETILKDVTLGEVHDWNFQAAAGDTIYGRYYLPPHFDPNKKYPLIVNYYGGTSPTERSLENRYPSHAYAALGYIVYIIQPSGATGFGQEFSARHVNAWGKRTGDEIIEGTKKFCAEHSFVDTKKIGCIGASYGGFMTQYLQTKTDLFAAAISHAGISDITSYWGEGYWGYSYSSLATANSYPWNARDIYVEQSPLFHADKINTPILFLHGSVDTNVPVGESIQMFTALKLLGKETAFIQVVGQNHQIFDYKKRAEWNNTIYAWFAKWLKEQPEWWEALYPQKSL
ncbi:S9 family peptidase [Parabacteroides gordonii]|jgi:dipeptidyl aminopeptidase/acylaminoacyl peptidase|uniref:S9 family peptidase n=1 Tax=Parabacteroides gordonii TaxID=574930 RepID=UPI000EC58E54|nr:prolyl oligopeptidase family serine peptidase [Parabacteroides gordonii]RGP16114.1 S9 family peptidase [Parabacteroides gordonii]